MEKRKNISGAQLTKGHGKAMAISLTAVLMAFSVVTLVPEPGLAKEQNRHRPSPEIMAEHLSARLQLTPEQQAAVTPVIAEEVQKRRELRDRHWTEDEARRQQVRDTMAEIDRETADELATILSPEQLEQFSQLREGRRVRMASRREGRGDRDRWPANCPTERPLSN